MVIWEINEGLGTDTYVISQSIKLLDKIKFSKSIIFCSDNELETNYLYKHGHKNVMQSKSYSGNKDLIE